MSSLTHLNRPRCRAAVAEPDAEGFDWQALAPLPPFEGTLWRRSDIPRTEVRAAVGAAALHVRFDCFLREMALLAPPSQTSTLGEVERALLRVHPRNDPTDYFLFQADHKGLRSAERVRAMPGEPYHGGVRDLWTASSKDGLTQTDWSLYHGLGTDRWWVELIIPWRLLGLEAAPVTLGFTYGRAYATGIGYPRLDEAGWPAPRALSADALHAGELCIGAQAGHPERLKLDAPRFGWNAGSLMLGAAWPKPPAAIEVRTEAADGALIRSQRVVVNGAVAPIRYWLERAASSHLALFNGQRLAIVVQDAGGGTLYQARLPFERHLGICVDEPYGEAQAAGRVAHEEVSLRDAWLDRAVRALPRLRRATTLDGAPSDFCLVHEDGRVAVNLMADDAWRALARLVEERFAGPEDRLVGAMALVGQKSVTNLILETQFFDHRGRHTYHSAAHEMMGPLSIIRFGGGPAVSRAAVLSRLLMHIRNPADGRPFVTRTLSLGADGGPRRAGRRFAGNSNLAPFAQEPGRAGATAVDYGGQVTLLDPTGLVFFPKADGRLATLAEIAADRTLRESGAGALADVYARIDAEEVERLPAGRLLSRGVFPELCPNEEGPAGEFSLRAVQRPRALVAGQPGVLGELMEEGGRPAHRRAAVTVSRDGEALVVEVRVAGVALAALAEKDRAGERVHVAIDAGHAHWDFHHFVVAGDGARDAWREVAAPMQTLFRNLASENWTEEKHLDRNGWSGAMTAEGETYRVRFALPLQILERADLPPVIGLNVWVEGRHPRYEEAFLAPPRYRLPVDPFSFADVYLSEAAIVAREVDYGVSCWGANRARVALANTSAQPVAVELHFETRLCMRRHTHRGEAVRLTVPPRGEAATDVPYFIDPEEKMTSGQGQQVALIVRRGNDVVIRSGWHLTYAAAPGVYQRYGPALGAPRDPRAGDGDFVQRKTDFICSRLPDFRRLTTRDGASGDFVIRADDGSVEFNFMRPGVLDEMARYVEGRFDTDTDRLLGIYFLSYHPAVARHLSSGHRFNNGCGPLSLIRLFHAGGGGNCGFHSRVFAGMASHLRIGGRPLTAHTLGISGHCIAAVEWNGSKALLDADVGHFLLSGDGAGLATVEQLRRREPILTTAGEGDLSRYFTFHEPYTLGCQGIRDDTYDGVFPAGAPKA